MKGRGEGGESMPYMEDCAYIYRARGFHYVLGGA